MLERIKFSCFPFHINNRKSHHTSGFLVSSFRTASSVIRSCLNKTAVCAAADNLNHPSITTTPVWKQRLSVSLLRIQISRIIYYMTIHTSFLGQLQKGKKKFLSDPQFHMTIQTWVKRKYLKYTLFLMWCPFTIFAQNMDNTRKVPTYNTLPPEKSHGQNLSKRIRKLRTKCLRQR